MLLICHIIHYTYYKISQSEFTAVSHTPINICYTISVHSESEEYVSCFLTLTFGLPISCVYMTWTHHPHISPHYYIYIRRLESSFQYLCIIIVLWILCSIFCLLFFTVTYIVLYEFKTLNFLFSTSGCLFCVYLISSTDFVNVHFFIQNKLKHIHFVKLYSYSYRTDVKKHTKTKDIEKLKKTK